MHLWLETVTLILAAVLGFLLGTFFSRQVRPLRLLGYGLPLSLIAALLLTRYCPACSFIAPFSWMAAGRARFIVYAFTATMGLTVPLSRLPHRFERIFVAVVMQVFVLCFALVPFIAPVFFRDTLANLTTRFDPDGVCLQSTQYTCGPAAAVTALQQLGISADEGELAVLAYCSPITGTLPMSLCEAIERKYENDGLRCRYRSFKSIQELESEIPALVVVRDALLRDHCMTVLGVSDSTVIVGDPAFGKVSIPCDYFRRIWRFSGIVLSRGSTSQI